MDREGLLLDAGHAAVVGVLRPLRARVDSAAAVPRGAHAEHTRGLELRRHFPMARGELLVRLTASAAASHNAFDDEKHHDSDIDG